MGNLEAQILQLSAIVAAAEKRKDADVVARYISPDYLGIDPSGALIDKSMLIARYRSEHFTLSRLDLLESRVKATPDCAWESGLMELAGVYGEKRFVGRYRYTHFWMRSEAGWAIAGSQMTPMPESPT